MKIYTTLLLFVLAAFDLNAAAGRPPGGSGFNPFSRGGSPIGGGGTSSSSSSGGITNLPDYALTNNQSSVVTLNNNLIVNGNIINTNNGVAGQVAITDTGGNLFFAFTVNSAMATNSIVKMPVAISNGVLAVSMDAGSSSNGTAYWLPFASFADSTNHLVEAASFHVVTNMIYFPPPTRYNGSNGTSAVNLTNAWDFTAGVVKSITNRVGTNMTWLLTNIVETASALTYFEGLPGRTSRVFVTTLSGGTNVIWSNWKTNGTYDIDVRGGYWYGLQMFALNQTTIVASVTTTDPYVIANFVTLQTPAGFTLTNAIVGGTLYKSITARTNLNSAIGSLTNLDSWAITGHTLTNNGDELTFQARGKLLAGSNSFVVYLGSNAMLTTGTITNNATDYDINGSIVRTGQGQQTFVSFRWGQGNGTSYGYTNSLQVDALQTNGHPSTVLALQGASMRPFGISNLFFRVDYNPMPR